MAQFVVVEPLGALLFGERFFETDERRVTHEPAPDGPRVDHRHVVEGTVGEIGAALLRPTPLATPRTQASISSGWMLFGFLGPRTGINSFAMTRLMPARVAGRSACLASACASPLRAGRPSRFGTSCTASAIAGTSESTATPQRGDLGRTAFRVLFRQGRDDEGRPLPAPVMTTVPRR